jgi:undecaprenyl-diphosphatase
VPMSRRAIAVYAFFILLFGVFCYFAHRFDSFPNELSLSLWVQGIDFAGVKPIMHFVPYALILVVVVALRPWLPSRRRGAAFIALATFAAVLASWLIKLMVNRPRPDSGLICVMEGAFSTNFPSMHLAGATVICGFIFYLAPRLVKTPMARYFLRALAVVIILAIGISRLYLGTHWLSDVVGGLFLGGLIFYPAIVIYRKYESRQVQNA